MEADGREATVDRSAVEDVWKLNTPPLLCCMLLTTFT